MASTQAGTTGRNPSAPVDLTPEAAGLRDAYAFVRDYEAAHPWIRVFRPWSHYNRSPRWLIVAPPLANRTFNTLLDVRDALKEGYPS